MKISFFVPGIPKTAGSKRGIPIYRGKKGQKVFTGHVAVVESCEKSKDWRGDVIKFATEAYKGPLIKDAIRLKVWFCFPRPKSHYGTGRNKDMIKEAAPDFHTKKPDATKLLRAVEDALTGVIWKDDAQIIKQTVDKDYVHGGNKPGAIIEIYY